MTNTSNIKKNVHNTILVRNLLYLSISDNKIHTIQNLSYIKPAPNIIYFVKVSQLSTINNLLKNDT